MITVVGSINLDLIARVGRLPGPGETVTGSAFDTAPGGKGANQALAARRAGSAVRMVGAVGRDAFAREATALLDEAGVDLSDVRQVEAPTGTALILVGGGGENMIAVIPGANAAVEAGTAAVDGRRGGMLLLQLEIALPAVEAALSDANRAGITSVLNIAPYNDEALGFAGKADYVVANETEFDLLANGAGIEHGDRAARMQAWVDRTGRIIVVTLGGDGVAVASPHGSFKIPAMRISPVDTVGAGDTFCGYLADGLSRDLGLEEAVRRASVAGSLACLKRGAQPSIPTSDEVDAAIRQDGA